jgi:hypothetical protein
MCSAMLKSYTGKRKIENRKWRVEVRYQFPVELATFIRRAYGENCVPISEANILDSTGWRHGLVMLNELKHLRIRKERLPGVWHITLPLLPWNYRAAMKERESLVESLAEKLPFLALWSSIDCPPDKELCWSHLTSTSFLKSMESLHEGAWALFFFDRSPLGLVQNIEYVPKGGNRLLRLLDTMSACATIVSWYDDREWILASSNPALTQSFSTAVGSR